MHICHRKAQASHNEARIAALVIDVASLGWVGPPERPPLVPRPELLRLENRQVVNLLDRLETKRTWVKGALCAEVIRL